MDDLYQIHSAAMKIYYYLLKEGELSLDKNRDLYLLYSDDQVKAALEISARESDSTVEKYNQVIYLIPSEDNTVLGFRETELQKIIGSSQLNKRETGYLSQYIISLLYTLFYSGQGHKIKSRDFIRIPEVVEEISKRLEYASHKPGMEERQEEAKFNIVSIYRHWNALPTDEPNMRNTKFGYVRSVCSFLDKQHLLQYDAAEEDIRPTQRLTNLMSYNFLNKDRQAIIERLFEKEGEPHAED